MQSIKDLGAARNLILWAELAGLLHDVGKLSTAFYDYRKKWRRMEDGWNRDPHDHGFLDKRDNHYNIVKEFFEQGPPLAAASYFKDAEKCSLGKMVNEHIEPKDDLTRLLNAADAKDAALDRNNPLFTADQTEGALFDTDVFGVEFEARFDPDKADELRRRLYEDLANPPRSLLQNYFGKFGYEERTEILKIIQSSFSNVFSDTTRPDNDTSLWEHSYAVASIFRVLVAHRIIYGETLDTFPRVRFGILGFGWDGLGFLSQGEKIGDILGRAPIIEELKERIRRLIECEHALGNMIYEDNDGIYFIVPALVKEVRLGEEQIARYQAYLSILNEIKTTAETFAVEETAGDLQIQYYMAPDTKFITQVTKCIETIKNKTVVPVNINPGTQNKIQEAWQGKKDPVCSICLRRPVTDDKLKRCEICNNRRIRFYTLEKKVDIAELERLESEQGTPFIGDIVKASEKEGVKRACLLVARFHLNRWLDGRMVRSLFVTEARGLEREVADLGNTRSFEGDERASREWLEHSPMGNLIRSGYDFERIKKEIDLSYYFDPSSGDEKREYAKNTLFLYDRRIKKNQLNRQPETIAEDWKTWLEDSADEYRLQMENPSSLLYNILCSKTPTPSTVLDVWETTKGFFEDITGQAKDSGEESGILRKIPISYRFIAGIALGDSRGVSRGAAYPGYVKKGDTILEKGIELVLLKTQDGKDVTLLIGTEYDEGKKESWKGAGLWLEGKSFQNRVEDFTLGEITSLSKYQYRPMRVISTSPDLLLAIVPAAKAVEITQHIYDQYIKKFGKVLGRLPLSIGNIFFEEHMPMFVVLDSARRLVRNFEMLGKKPVEVRVSRKHIPVQKQTLIKNVTTVINSEGGPDVTVVTAEKKPVKEPDISIKLDQINWQTGLPAERSFEWRLPYQSGDGETDYHHPYFIVKKEEDEPSRFRFRKSYFRTVVGDVIHFTEIQPGDTLLVYPNYYDFEFLDTSTRRYDLNLTVSRKRRKSNVTGFPSKPYLLHDLGARNNSLPPDQEDKEAGSCPWGGKGLGLQILWQAMKDNARKDSLMPGLTDTRLRNIESLWLAKLREWEVEPEQPDCENFKRWAGLVEATLKREFPDRYNDLTLPRNMEDFEFLKEAVFSGLFFDCLELHLRILKEKVSKEE